MSATEPSIVRKIADLGWRIAACLPGHAYLARAFYRRGNALLEAQRPLDALANYDCALRLRSDYADAHYNCGLALQHMGQAAAAIASYDRALAIKPDDCEALNNRGNALLDLHRPDAALASYDRAIAIKADYADACVNRGNALRDLTRPQDAVASYDRALAIDPGHADALYNRGNALGDVGQLDAAIASYRQAIATIPDSSEARWCLVMAWAAKLAVVPDDIDAAKARAEFMRGLRELEDYFDSRQLDGAHFIGVMTPFSLAYHESNHRDLLIAYGRLCAKLMQRWHDKQPVAYVPIAPDSVVVKVGIVSAFVRDHSVWHAIVKGWIRQFDPAVIEVHVFCLSLHTDGETEIAKSLAASFTYGKHGLGEWVAAIADKRPDILIYPEIGMDPMTAKLASLRLATTQMTTWGHPETSGLPTIDYYISAAALEPPRQRENYSEKLIMLPNLGVYHEQVPVEAGKPDLARMGIRLDVPMFVCAGAPFKYAPRHDYVYVEIARRLGACQFVFFTWQVPALSELLKNRLIAAFAAAHMNYSDYVVFVPWQSKREFYGLMNCADAYLDTLGFSGFNTTLQAIECNLPVAAYDGRFMRGRLASGILRRMGIEDLIARNVEDFVRLVVRLGQDAAFRHRMRERMRETQGLLFDDVSAVHALQVKLVELAGTNRAGTATAV